MICGKNFMKISKLSALLCPSLLLSPVVCFAEATQEHTLTVIVDGAVPNKGQVILSVFNSKADFLKNPEVNMVQRIDSSGTASFFIPGIRAGNYAISAVYDEDTNGELNTGFMGIPTELVGFSNNAKGFMGPPSFEEALFEVETPMKLSIQLGKAKK